MLKYNKPIIYDGDTGGKPEHLAFTVKTLERLGLNIIIEDKIGLKKLSFGTKVKQQDTIENFSHKIKTAIQSRVTMILWLLPVLKA